MHCSEQEMHQTGLPFPAKRIIFKRQDYERGNSKVLESDDLENQRHFRIVLR